MMMSLMVFIAGCGTIDNTAKPDGKSTTGNSGNELDTDGNNSDSQLYSFSAQIIEVNNSILVTPDKDSNESRSSDRITVSMAEEVIKGLDGNSMSKDELKPGDIVKITYDGSIRESYPAQITASMIELTERNILVDGYLALIDEILKIDPALNDDISKMALNTKGWTALTDIEKETVFQALKGSYELDIIEGSFDELAQQGLIDKEKLYFPDGILITIKNFEYNEKEKSISCSIDKWRSGTGAIGANDVTAEYKDGKWDITLSDMWIS